jgi:hypothetical protein
MPVSFQYKTLERGPLISDRSTLLHDINLSVQGVQNIAKDLSLVVNGTARNVQTIVDVLPEVSGQVTTITQEIPEMSSKLAAIHDEMLPIIMSLLRVRPYKPTKTKLHFMTNMV